MHFFLLHFPFLTYFQLYCILTRKPLLSPGGSVKILEATENFCELTVGHTATIVGSLVYLMGTNILKIPLFCPILVSTFSI